MHCAVHIYSMIYLSIISKNHVGGVSELASTLKFVYYQVMGSLSRVRMLCIVRCTFTIGLLWFWLRSGLDVVWY
jgi:hypothetical protein